MCKHPNLSFRRLRGHACFVVVFLAYGLSARAQSPSGDGLGAYQQALSQTVLLRNTGQQIPLLRLDTLRIAFLPMSEGESLSVFQEYLERYTEIARLDVPASGAAAWAQEQLKHYNLFVLAAGGSIPALSSPAMEAWNVFSQKARVALALFDAGQLLAQYPELAGSELLIAGTGTYYGQSLAAQALFGGTALNARLAQSLGVAFRPGEGLDLPPAIRLGYAPPELVGMNGQLLKDSVEAILLEGLQARAYPGAQVLIAKDEKVVYHRAFGAHTYEDQHPVQLADIYDFASVTKITSGLPVLMEWYGQGKFDPDAPLADYLPEVKGTNKAALPMRRLLTHTAQLMAWIPFWKGVLKGQSRNPWQKRWDGNRNNDFRFKARTFRTDSSAAYNVFVTDSLWLHRKYNQIIYKSIYQSPLNEKPGFVYSDFFFYTMPRIVKYQTGVDFETYIKSRFYRPLGATTLTLNPLRFFPPERIIPTERDTFFRMKLLRGTVHDEGAAMLGGVSGHAGLFGSANDLAKLMQMYMNFGEYGGQRFIEEKAVREFIRCQYCEEGVHRGLGFDKPALTYNPASASYAPQASASSFGHTGFTGTYTWVDPETRLLVIVFSNRVYPFRSSRALLDLGIRRRVHEAAYLSMQSN